jgi:drug/metabolite transporter (DMT)-like permease
MSDAPPAAKTLSPNALGALWMVGSGLGFTIMAACVKALAAKGYSESLMIFYRSAAGLLAMTPFLLAAGRSAWTVRRPGKVLLRSLYGTVGFFAGFYALAHLPLAEAQALSFSRTLFMVILAIWLLKEKVAWRRWSAVGIGFVGIVIMTRPWAVALDLGAAMAIASAFAFALAIITVKDLTRDHSTITLVLYANVLTTIAGLPFAFMGWAWPSLGDFGLLMLLGASGIAAQSCYVRALSTGEASLMGIVDYVRLPMAAIAGYVLFAEAPDRWAIIGAGVVITATLYITVREAQIGKAKTVPASPE